MKKAQQVWEMGKLQVNTVKISTDEYAYKQSQKC